MTNNGLNVNTAYKYICQGFSVDESTGIYIKHFNSFEMACVGDFFDKNKKLFISKGAKTQPEILELKIKSGEWSIDFENKISSIQQNIKLMAEKRSKASLPSQLDEINSIIEDYNKELFPLLSKKNSLFELSAENLTESTVTDFILSISLFSDELCKNPLFAFDDVEHFSSIELNKYIDLYKNNISVLDYHKIREVSVYPKFYHFFKTSVSAESFFGKRGMDLTQNQVILFDSAKYFEKLLENIEDLTEEERLIPEEIENAYILSKNAENTNQDSSLRTAFAKAKMFNSG